MIWIGLGVAVVLTLIVRARLAGMPLERDEGEFAYGGQLLRDGVAPYQSLYSMKFPGMYVLNALFLSVFGDSATAIRTGLLLTTLTTGVFLFFVARKLVGPAGAPAAAACHLALSLSAPMLGLHAHATHFVAFFAVAGLLVLMLGVERDSAAILAAAGALFGSTILVKQPGAVFLVFALLWLLFAPPRAALPATVRLRQSACVALGAAAPLVMTGLWLAAAGVWPRFWLWTVRYAGAYSGLVTVKEGAGLFVEVFIPIMLSAWLLWVAAVAALVAVLILERRPGVRFAIVGFAAACAASVVPGLYFREHYFLTLTPAVGLAVGWAVTVAIDGARARPAKGLALLPGLILLLGLAHTCWDQRAVFFRLPPAEVVRALHGPNPFAEAPAIARYIADHSAADDTVAILGSEPEILFYAKRRSATGYIYTYPLVEPHRFAREMQEEMIRDVEASRPQFFVFVDAPMSWLAKPDTPRLILDWIPRYAQENYDVVGIVEIPRRGIGRAWWGADIAHAAPSSPATVQVGVRKEKL